MQATTTKLGTAARFLLPALLSLVLVALGATGARAFPEVPTPAPASMPAPVVAAVAASVQPSSVARATAATPAQERFGSLGSQLAGPAGAPDTPAVLVDQASQEQTTCIPGRKKVRLESAAALPSYALLQHAPEPGQLPLPRTHVPGHEDARLSGRIPASLTHLDLGIVRT